MSPILVGGPDRHFEDTSWLRRARLPIITLLAIGSWGPTWLFCLGVLTFVGLLV